jgi:hypothetical protein
MRPVMAGGVKDGMGAGSSVSVRSQLSGKWVSGFEVVKVTQADDRLVYGLCRCSDRYVLPMSFAAEDMRVS